MLSLSKKGMHGIEIDYISVADELSKCETSQKQALNLAHLLHLQKKHPSFTGVFRWKALRLRNLHIYRQLDGIGSDISRKAKSLPDDPSLMISEAISSISKLQEQSQTSDPSIKGSDALDSFIKKYDQILTGKFPEGIFTGYKSIDNKIGGLCPPDLIILAARPGMGKTAFSMNIMVNIAKNKNKVLIFSLEMSRMQLLQRIVASYGRLDAFLIKKGVIPIDKLAPIIGKLRPILDFIHIDDSSYISVDHIRAISQREKPDVIMIDYLQLLKGNNDLSNRNMQISEISGNLKQIAKDLNIPILCLSQLNRDPDSRKNKRPLISDLRDSGSIEQDSDLVIFIYRDSYYNRDGETDSKSEIIIAKNRHGSTGTIYLYFDSKSTLFLDK